MGKCDNDGFFGNYCKVPKYLVNLMDYYDSSWLYNHWKPWAIMFCKMAPWFLLVDKLTMVEHGLTMVYHGH